MKDQRALANKCLKNEIPFFTLCGTDILAIRTLESYLRYAKEANCDAAFVQDLEELINDFKQYAAEEPETLKIPD